MIEYINKNVTTPERGIIAHGCNCQGVMGSGVALAVKNKWPRAFERYVAVCGMSATKSNLLGLAHIVNVGDELYVSNMFTQEKYGRDGKRYADPQAIEEALQDTFAFARSTGNLPIYMPRVGCGLGGLKWERDVEPVVKKLAESFPEINVFVCDL